MRTRLQSLIALVVIGLNAGCAARVTKTVGTSGTLAELRSLYIDLFEAGLPQPRCPLLESAWLLNRPAGDVVLENKLYYQNFGLEIDGRAAPDSLLTQLEFLAWLDYCESAGNLDVESVKRARAEFLERHLSHWVGSLAHLSENAGGGCYAELLEALAREVEAALAGTIESSNRPGVPL